MFTYSMQSYLRNGNCLNFFCHSQITQFAYVVLMLSLLLAGNSLATLSATNHVVVYPQLATKNGRAAHPSPWRDGEENRGKKKSKTHGLR